MNPRLSKLNFAVHVLFSISWIGAVAAFLVLSITTQAGSNVEIVRGAYLSMNLVGQYLIVPLSLAALLTGLLQSLGTAWGLFRYYWVLVKFILTTIATLLLLLHQFKAVSVVADRVLGSSAGTLPNVGKIGTQLVVDSSLGIVVLVIVTVLGIYKPWGLIRKEVRRQAQGSEIKAPSDKLPLGLKFLLLILGLALAFVVILHLTGHSPMMHNH